MFERFDHLTLAVHTLGPTLASYEALLGRPATWRGAHRGLGTESAIFGLENGLIELTAALPDAVESEGLRTLLSERGEGISALALGTDDADACYARLRERGLRVTPPAHDDAHGPDGVLRHYALIEVSPRMSRGVPILALQRADTEALRGPPGIPEACVNALDHVVIRTADLAAARVLYGDMLGLRAALDTRIGGIGMLFFRVGGVTIEVIEDPGAGAADAFFGMALRVRDIDAAHLRLSASAFDVSAIRPGKKPLTRVFSLRNPPAGVPTLVISDPARR